MDCLILPLNKRKVMKDQNILNLLRLPARLDTRQVALALGFSEHDIPILIRSNLLKSLGNAAPNAPKYFAACDIERLAGDRDWLNKATKSISSHWRTKNGRRADREN